MVRPYKTRGIQEPPRVQSFKPAGIPMRFLERITLTVDEFEAIRLADYKQHDHRESARMMGISRPTFSRLIERARQKIGEALFEVKEIYIQGGNVYFRNNLFRCGRCGTVIRISMESRGPVACGECGSLNVIDLARQSAGSGCRDESTQPEKPQND